MISHLYFCGLCIVKGMALFMNKLRFTSIIIFIISLPFINIALKLYHELYAEVRDGDGIGLYFLGIEINDKLSYEQIPSYFWGFLTVGLLLIVISFFLFFKTKNK